jgi:hypothetical protein
VGEDGVVGYRFSQIGFTTRDIPIVATIKAAMAHIPTGIAIAIAIAIVIYV